MNPAVLFFSLISISMVALRCSKDSATGASSVNMGYNYFPGELNSYVIYEVDSIDYDDIIHPPDTFRYLLKEKIAEQFLDNSGRPTLRIERYYKIYNKAIPYDSMQWLGPRIWTANKTSTTLERKEENIVYLRLVFPVERGKTWNGNIYNMLGEKEYEVISADQPGAISNFSFDSVAVIKQFENINFIEERYEEEQYARNIGLIYKHITSIYHGGDTTKKVGYKFTQRIVGYGK